MTYTDDDITAIDEEMFGESYCEVTQEQIAALPAGVHFYKFKDDYAGIAAWWGLATSEEQAKRLIDNPIGYDSRDIYQLEADGDGLDIYVDEPLQEPETRC